MQIKVFLSSLILASLLVSGGVYATDGNVAIILNNSTFDQFTASDLVNLSGPSHHQTPEALLFPINNLESLHYSRVSAKITVKSKPGCSCIIESNAIEVSGGVNYHNSNITNIGGKLCYGVIYDGRTNLDLSADISRCN